MADLDKRTLDQVKIPTVFDVKDSVKVASTGNLTLYGEQTIDGVLTSKSRVLVKDQSSGEDNGIYVTSSGAWSRSEDANNNEKLTSSMYLWIEEGTVNADQGFVITTNDPITLDTTSLTFTQFTGTGQITAGTGLTKTANTINAIGTTGNIVANADSLDIGANVLTDTSVHTLTNKTINADGTGNSITNIENADIKAGAAIDLSKLATDPLARVNHTGTQLASTVSNFDTQVKTNTIDSMAAATDITTRDATTLLHGLMPKLDKIKLDGIEASATADQSNAEIKTAYELNADTNAFTDANVTTLGNQSGTNTGDEVSASATVEGVVELATIAELDTGTDTTRAVTCADIEGSARSAKLDAIEASATADQTGAEIKTALELEANTNTITDAEQTILQNTSGTNTGDEVAASSTVSGVAELATITEINTGTDALRTITPAGLAGSALQTKVDGIEALADVTDATNVNAAGALMLSDTTTAGLGIAIDEDNMASDLDTRVPTQQSVKAYVDTEIGTALTSDITLKGDYNASTNSPDLDTTPIAITKGDHYVTSVAGTFFTIPLEVGDSIIAKQDTATLESHWIIAQANLTPATIKTQYESNADTNAYDDASVTSVGTIASKAPLASPTFTGTVVLPNVPAIVTTQLNLKAPLISPTLVTPVLGTVAAGSILTNATGLPATTGLTATGTKDATTFLRGDDTWAVVASYLAPTIGSTSIASGSTNTTIAGLTLTSPTLGTPVSGVATNLTGTAAGLTSGNVTTNANLTGDVTSVGNATTIAAGAVDVAMLANGTDGELITWDAAGSPTTVAVGTATQVLTSNGAGAAPTFQDGGGGKALLGADSTPVTVVGTTATEVKNIDFIKNAATIDAQTLTVAVRIKTSNVGTTANIRIRLDGSASDSLVLTTTSAAFEVKTGTIDVSALSSDRHTVEVFMDDGAGDTITMDMTEFWAE